MDIHVDYTIQKQDQCRNVETIQILFGERQVKMMQL